MKNFQFQNILFKLCKFWLFITFLQSLYAWFTWGQLSKSIILIITLIHCTIFAAFSKKYFLIRKSNFLQLIFFTFAELYIIKAFGALNLTRAIVQILIVAFVLFLKDEHKIDLLRYLTRSVAFILFISLLAWVLFLIGVGFPHFVIKHPDFNYWYDNYYVFLADNKGIVPRFCSIFLEPGHLGMITAFLLFANRFDLKRKDVLIIFIATLFTLSLAAYVLTFISATAYIIFDSKHKTSLFVFSKRKILFVVLFTVFIFTSIYTVLHYNKGNNIVNRAILSRLKYKNGNISGNDRFSHDFTKYFDSFKKSNKVVLGIGNEFLKMKWKKGNAGWKVFLVQYGIIGILLVFLLYFSFIYYNQSIMTLIFLLIYILNFLQAAYPLWLCELFIFITAMPLLKTFEKQKSYVKQVYPN